MQDVNNKRKLCIWARMGKGHIVALYFLFSISANLKLL